MQGDLHVQFGKGCFAKTGGASTFLTIAIKILFLLYGEYGFKTKNKVRVSFLSYLNFLGIPVVISNEPNKIKILQR